MCSHQHICLKPKDWYSEVFCKTLHFPVCEHRYRSDFSLLPWSHSLEADGFFRTILSYLLIVIISQFSRFRGDRHWFLSYFHLRFFSLSEQEWSLLDHENGFFFLFYFFNHLQRSWGLERSTCSVGVYLGGECQQPFLALQTAQRLDYLHFTVNSCCLSETSQYH